MIQFVTKLHPIVGGQDSKHLSSGHGFTIQYNHYLLVNSSVNLNGWNRDHPSPKRGCSNRSRMESPGRDVPTVFLWLNYIPVNFLRDTVGGRNPAPPGMYKTLKNNGINYISFGAGFCPSTVSSSSLLFILN